MWRFHPQRLEERMDNEDFPDEAVLDILFLIIRNLDVDQHIVPLYAKLRNWLLDMHFISRR